MESLRFVFGFIKKDIYDEDKMIEFGNRWVKKIKLLMRNATYWPGIVLEINGKTLLLCLCHHQPERSIVFLGIEKYLCARCLGICIGGIFGAILLLIHIIPSFPFIILLMIPLVVDGLIQAFIRYESTNIRRIISGALFGFGIIQISFISTQYLIQILV